MCVCIYIYIIFLNFVKRLVYSILKVPMPLEYCTVYVQYLQTGFAKNFELVKSTQSNRITKSKQESVFIQGKRTSYLLGKCRAKKKVNVKKPKIPTL